MRASAGCGYLKSRNFKPKVILRQEAKRMALQGRHALVTGGGRGIGRAIAATLAGVGCAVTVTGRSEASLREAMAAGDAAGFVIADATDGQAVAKGIEAAVAARGT